MKGISTSKKHLCHICGNHHGCKNLEDGLVLCLRGNSQQDAPSGYRFIKPLRNQMGGLFVANDSNRPNETWQDRIDRINQRRAQERQAARLLSIEERDHYYRAVVSQLGRSQEHVQVLLERGLTPAEIEQAGFRSWEPGKRVMGATSQLAGIDSRGDRLMGSKGIFIPAYDPQGNITGAQIKTNSGRPGKYIWLSSHKEDGMGGNGPQLPNGELPLFVWKHPLSLQTSSVILCEGALKSAIAALLLWRLGLTNIAVIGTASSGSFGSDTLKSYLRQLSPQRVQLAPDAGAVNNTSNIPAANWQTIKLCQAWGYSIDVLWWGQTHKKQHLDIDELLVAGRWSEVQTIGSDEFFQLHPAAIRERLENHTPQRAGLQRFDFPVANPHPKESDHVPIEYEADQRRQTWMGRIKAGDRFILDGSATGLGKSYDAGLLQPSDFGVSQIVFVTNDPRNLTTDTLKDWTINQGRHGGLVITPGPNDTTQIRRARKGETPNIKSNCDRHRLAEILPERNVEATGTHICPGCKHRKTCKLGTGEFTYLFDRQNALSQERLISHIDSLDPNAFPGDGDSPSVVLVLDEASQQKLVKSFLVRWADIDRTLVDLKANYPTEAAQLEPALLALASQQGTVTATTIDHLKILKLLPPLPSLSDEDLLRISLQRLEFLAPDRLIEQHGFAPGTRVSDLPRDVRKIFKQDARQLASTTEHALALRWLPEFWQAVKGDGRLRLTPEGLQITTIDTHRLEVLTHPSVKAVILLDATKSPQYFERWLKQPVTYICARTPEKVAEIEVVQVTGLGLMGFSRGKRQQQHSAAVVEALLQQHPDASVIDAMKYARDGSGYWFRDSRGRNAFQHASALILVGAPLPQLGAAIDEFALMTGRHPDTNSVLRSYTLDATNTPAGGPWWVRSLQESADPKLAAFYRQCVLEEFEQAVGRLRGNRRPGEKITVYVLSDYPLGQPVKLIEASAIASTATPKSIVTEQQIEQAIAQLEKLGRVTLKVIAQLVKTSFGRISKSAAWKAYRQRVSRWFVVFPNAINNISARKNYKPHATPDPEPPLAVQTLAVSAPVGSVCDDSAPTPHVSQHEELPTSKPLVATRSVEARDRAWGVGLLLPGSIVECFGRAGQWAVRYCTGIFAKIVDRYGEEEIVSCKDLRLAGIVA
jgi:rhodanese-related sulfurtransferase